MGLPSSGGGGQGSKVTIAGVCASALTTVIAALITAGTEVNGINVICSTGANREFTVVTEGVLPQGKIVDWGYITSTTYWITVEMVGYLNKAATWCPANTIETYLYSVAPSLGDSISYYDADQVKSDDAGAGRVIDLNTSATTCDVLI